MSPGELIDAVEAVGEEQRSAFVAQPAPAGILVRPLRTVVVVLTSKNWAVTGCASNG